MDENGRALYASCHSRSGIGFVYVFRVKDTHTLPLELIGRVVSGTEVSLATGHAPVPRDITVLPQSNYLFYVDVSPFLPSPAIIQCQLDGRKCEAWLSKSEFRLVFAAKPAAPISVDFFVIRSRSMSVYVPWDMLSAVKTRLRVFQMFRAVLGSSLAMMGSLVSTRQRNVTACRIAREFQ
ncbi:unnamed protein product [Heligmosomoides polygyrus]|uniref:IgGFc_binding domain-containing protein n=1 Tax=Heligmosomoides polygyrus TaxID=6339 RepID=A0A183GMA9_HELPZ|nr:unnamed protein product [Heligmosomoides polygyrus]